MEEILRFLFDCSVVYNFECKIHCSFSKLVLFMSYIDILIKYMLLFKDID